MDQNSLHWIYFVGNTYNRVYIWCCKYGENRYYERCANKQLCASKHTGLLNSCLGKLCLHPYLVVPLISARVTLISTRVSAHCQAILFHLPFHRYIYTNIKMVPLKLHQSSTWRIHGCVLSIVHSWESVSFALWGHSNEILSALLALYEGNYRWIPLTKDQWCGT